MRVARDIQKAVVTLPNYGLFDDIRFPNDLANCTLCHVGKAYLPENVPADAPPTVANENPWIMHASNASAHSSGEA